MGWGKNTLEKAINQSLEDQGVQVGLGQALASPGNILALSGLWYKRDGGQRLGLRPEGETHLFNRKVEAGAVHVCACACS